MRTLAETSVKKTRNDETGCGGRRPVAAGEVGRRSPAGRCPNLALVVYQRATGRLCNEDDDIATRADALPRLAAGPAIRRGRAYRANHRHTLFTPREDALLSQGNRKATEPPKEERQSSSSERGKATEPPNWRHRADSDLRKCPVRNVRVLHSVVDLPPGGSFPLWNPAKDSSSWSTHG